MNKFILSKAKASGLAALAATLLFSGAVLVNAAPLRRGNPNLSNASSSIAREANASSSQSHGSARKGLSNIKLKACQAKERSLKERSARLTDMAKSMENKFEAIAGRVENYYTNTVLPSGKTVANYNNLLSDIQTKKNAIGDALAKAQNDGSGFSCSASDPKNAMMQFRNDMKAVKQALKKYRTSIKNLIVAVHSVTGEEHRNSSSSAEMENKATSTATSTSTSTSTGQGGGEQ